MRFPQPQRALAGEEATRLCLRFPSLSQSADLCLEGTLGRAPPAGRWAKGRAGGRTRFLPSLQPSVLRVAGKVQFTPAEHVP